MTRSPALPKLAMLVGLLLFAGGAVLALRGEDAVQVASGPAAQHERSTSPTPSPIPGDRTSPPFTLRSGSVPLTEAVHQGNSNALSLDVRLSKPGIAMVSRGGSVNRQLPHWLQCLGAGRRIYWPPSLEILFCTWQI